MTASHIPGMLHRLSALTTNRCMDKRRDQRQLKKERVYFSFQLIVHHEGSLGKNSRRELKQRPWKNSAYWLVSHASFSCSFISTRSTSPGVVSPIVILDLACQLLIKKMPGRLASRPIWYKYFISWGYCFLNDLRLYRVNKKVTRIAAN